jgi:hypothetical protein
MLVERAPCRDYAPRSGSVNDALVELAGSRWKLRMGRGLMSTVSEPVTECRANDRRLSPGKSVHQFRRREIFAEEVEKALKHHPAVYDVVVAGTPSERWGEQVTAVVQFRPGETASDRDLIDTAAQHLARYKLPKAFVAVEQIVRSASGKPDYRWAKEMASKAR